MRNTEDVMHGYDRAADICRAAAAISMGRMYEKGAEAGIEPDALDGMTEFMRDIYNYVDQVLQRMRDEVQKDLEVENIALTAALNGDAIKM